MNANELRNFYSLDDLESDPKWIEAEQKREVARQHCEAIGWDYYKMVELYGPSSLEYLVWSDHNQPNMPVLPEMTPSQTEEMMEICQ